MYITRLELKNFRNYESLKADFDEKINLILGNNAQGKTNLIESIYMTSIGREKINLILGNNAQGKTNLIESIYMTSIGRSFRTAKDSDVIMFGRDEALIKVNAEKKFSGTEVEIRIKDASKKSVKKDGIPLKKSSELLENIMIVIFSPEDMKIVKDEPEKRRKFIDRELCQISPRYYDSLSNYKKILAQRNAYMKEESINPSLLDLWDSQLAGYGADIITGRKKFIENISGFSARIHSGITAGGEDLNIEYEPDVRVTENPEDQKMFFYEEIKKAFDSDMRNRSTTRGPHKDDISFFVNGINMRSFGSQGQQRTCALSLKLAELDLIKNETGEDAILLLDDVMSELDGTRQEYLIKTLKDNQLFITTTSLDERILGEFKNAKIFNIYQGKFR